MNIIKSLRQSKGLSQAQLARECGVHQTAVSQWENGHTLPDRAALASLSRIFAVSVDYLMGKPDNAEKTLVPVLGFVRAGIPVEAVEEILDYEEIPALLASTGEFFGLRVRGESMLPRFCPGDVVIVRRQEDVDSGEIAVVMVNGQDAAIKKVIKKGASLMLVSLNTDYEPLIFSASEVSSLPVTVCGKVVELRAKF